MKKTFQMLLFAAALVLSACKSEPIRVACLGDSITYGHGIMDREHDAYPGVLASMLGEKYDVRNFGVCGVTAMSGTDMPYVNEQLYHDAIEFNPQIVTIKLGTNDSKPRNWVSHENFKTDVKAMIAEVRSLPSKPQIWLCLPVPAMGNAWTINDSIIYNGVIPYLKEIAAEENLPLIDLNTPFQGQKQYFPDTIHPNEEGERKIAEIIFDRVFKKNRWKL